MTNNLQTSWYALIEDCRSILIETEFNTRWALIEGYHKIGVRILEDYEKLKKSKGKIVQDIAVALQRSERTIFYALEFARRFPVLTDLGALNKEGKILTWTKITHYLGGEEKEKTPCNHQWIEICKFCHAKK